MTCETVNCAKYNTLFAEYSTLKAQQPAPTDDFAVKRLTVTIAALQDQIAGLKQQQTKAIQAKDKEITRLNNTITRQQQQITLLGVKND